MASGRALCSEVAAEEPGFFPGPPGETRLIVRISVERIGDMAPGYKPWT